ncbi:MAG: cellulase family glycosylhydrolase [Planctomycetota bacterium]
MTQRRSVWGSRGKWSQTVHQAGFKVSDKPGWGLKTGSFRAALLLLLFCGSVLPAAELPWIIVNRAGTGFEEAGTGRVFDASGFNYDHDRSGRLLEDYWHTEWTTIVEDFREMRDLGARVVRIHLQFGRFMESPEIARDSELQQLRKLLELARETGLYLNITGLGCYHKPDVPDWYDTLAEGDRWAAQRVFWESIARVCHESPAVFCYDLMNEPVVGGEQPAADWLGPPFAGKHFVQFIARSTRGRQRTDVAAAWIAQLVTAIRQTDSRHLITVGLVDWSLARPGLTSGFVPAAIAPQLDFISVHHYPEPDKLTATTELLQGFQTGKPLVVEETFPLKCSPEQLEHIARRVPNISGWISFYWGRRIDEHEPQTSIGDAITTDWLSRFSAFLKDSPLVRMMAGHWLRHPDGKAAFAVDLAAWNQPSPGLPIGVFDSGIGGLTVLEAILTADHFRNDSLQPGSDGLADFRNERFIYLGDQANMPYGNYSSAKRSDFLRELILKDAAFLLGRRLHPTAPVPGETLQPRFDKPPVKAIVIACNTATAWGLEDIRQLTETLKLPVVVLGVVDSGSAAVVEQTRSDQRRTVAVLATVGTCSSNAWPRAIDRDLGLAGRPQAVIVQQGSRGIAGAIEGDPAFVSKDERMSTYAGPAVGHTDAPIDPKLLHAYGFDPDGLRGQPDQPHSLQLNSVTNYIRYDVLTLLENYRRSGGRSPIDTLVLGCTHFPLVQEQILAEFQRIRQLEQDGQRPWQPLIANQIDVVDPASLVARDLFRRLAEHQMFAAPPALDLPAAEPHLFYLSVPNPACATTVLNTAGALDTTWKYSRLPGQLQIEDTIVVPMTQPLLPASGLELIRRHLPEVSRRFDAGR